MGWGGISRESGNAPRVGWDCYWGAGRGGGREAGEGDVVVGSGGWLAEPRCATGDGRAPEAGGRERRVTFVCWATEKGTQPFGENPPKSCGTGVLIFTGIT